MYPLNQIKGHHFCLLIIAQGKWKKSQEATIAQNLRSQWSNIISPSTLPEHTSLFNPEKLGKKLAECPICLTIYNLFKKETKGKKYLLFFSHSVLEANELKTLFSSLLEDPLIQKLYYLEQNSTFYLIPPNEFIAKVKQNLRKRMPLPEFLRIIDYGQFETGILYELFPPHTKL
ncbi:MAG: hypothetical protein ACTSRS_17275 [Candidatus Helarchaeota archaeon]